MSAPLDLTKPVQTRCGWPARILCTDLKAPGVGVGEPLIVAAVTDEDGDETVWSYHSDGRHRRGHEDPLDLVQAPVRTEGWLNLYSINASPTRDIADDTALPFREGVIRITYEDGKPVAATLEPIE